MTNKQSNRLNILRIRYDVLIVANGSPLRRSLVKSLAAKCDSIIAVDGGLEMLKKADIVPQHCIGDFDSVSKTTLDWARHRQSRVHHRISPDVPDLAKGLQFCANHGQSTVLIAGFSGDRTDHLLSALHFAFGFPSLRVDLITDEVILVALRGRVAREYSVPRNHTVSWFGMPTAQGCTMSGVRWPFQNRSLKLEGFHSLSNGPESDSIRIKQQKGRSFLIISIKPASS